MKIQIVSKPAMTISGVKGYFNGQGSANANNFEVIPALWGNINAKAAAMSKQPDEWLGYMAESDQPDQGELIYIAGYQVTTDNQLNDAELVTVEVPAQQYALLPHHGLLSELGDTLNAFYGQWLPESGYNLGDGCGIEVYGPRFSPNSEESYFETWVPVVKA